MLIMIVPLGFVCVFLKDFRCGCSDLEVLSAVWFFSFSMMRTSGGKVF